MERFFTERASNELESKPLTEAEIADLRRYSEILERVLDDVENYKHGKMGALLRHLFNPEVWHLLRNLTKAQELADRANDVLDQEIEDRLMSFENAATGLVETVERIEHQAFTSSAPTKQQC